MHQRVKQTAGQGPHGVRGRGAKAEEREERYCLCFTPGREARSMEPLTVCTFETARS
jgi:hypothetical protein